jgi:hypothetical protein
MDVRRRYDIPVIVALVLAIAIYASFRSEFRLREKMPVEFFDASGIPPKKRVVEESIAKAYWRCAVTQIQWKYGYAHRLPEEVPAEFSITTNHGHGGDPAVRLYYWQKLRGIWTVASVWEKHYEWNTISLTNSLRSAGAWLEQRMRAILGYS